MDAKDLTIEQLTADRPDLIASITEAAQADTEAETLRTELTTLKATVAEHEATVAAVAKRVTVRKACTEAKLPDAVVTDLFVEQLVACEDDAAMQALIDDRKAIASGTPAKKPAGATTPVSKEQDLTEGADPTAITPGDDFDVTEAEGKQMDALVGT